MNNRKIAFSVALTVIGFSVILFTVLSLTKQNANPTTIGENTINADTNTLNSSTTNENTPEVNTPASQTYSASVNYSVPKGSETISIKLTLQDNVVTDVETTHSGNDRESEDYQNRFTNNIKTLVEGKSLANINLARVGGASLTTRAFMNALDDIEQQL